MKNTLYRIVHQQVRWPSISYVRTFVTSCNDKLKAFLKFVRTDLFSLQYYTITSNATVKKHLRVISICVATVQNGIISLGRSFQIIIKQNCLNFYASFRKSLPSLKFYILFTVKFTIYAWFVCLLHIIQHMGSHIQPLDKNLSEPPDTGQILSVVKLFYPLDNF